jgi:ribosome assembly protein YihI (activator of Der GTPase)
MGPYKVKTYGQALLDALQGRETTTARSREYVIEPVDENDELMPF